MMRNAGKPRAPLDRPAGGARAAAWFDQEATAACPRYRPAQYSGFGPDISSEPRASCSGIDVAAWFETQSCHTALVKTALPTGSAVATLFQGSGTASAQHSPFPNPFDLQALRKGSLPC